MSIDPVLPLSLEESGAKNFLFASLVKTSVVSLKRVFASALPVLHVIRQTPVRMAPAELNPFLPKVEIFGRGVSRQKGTRSDVSERVGGVAPHVQAVHRAFGFSSAGPNPSRLRPLVGCVKKQTARPRHPLGLLISSAGDSFRWAFGLCAGNRFLLSLPCSAWERKAPQPIHLSGFRGFIEGA